jgi:hypothetical protein
LPYEDHVGGNGGAVQDALQHRGLPASLLQRKPDTGDEGL